MKSKAEKQDAAHAAKLLRKLKTPEEEKWLNQWLELQLAIALKYKKGSVAQ